MAELFMKSGRHGDAIDLTEVMLTVVLPLSPETKSRACGAPDMSIAVIFNHRRLIALGLRDRCEGAGARRGPRGGGRCRRLGFMS